MEKTQAKKVSGETYLWRQRPTKSRRKEIFLRKNEKKVNRLKILNTSFFEDICLQKESYVICRQVEISQEMIYSLIKK